MVTKKKTIKAACWFNGTELVDAGGNNVLRFRTKAEFKEMFGANWRNKVASAWVDDMNQLFGRRVPKAMLIKIFDKCYALVEVDGDFWSVSLDMLTITK